MVFFVYVFVVDRFSVLVLILISELLVLEIMLFILVDVFLEFMVSLLVLRR